MQPGPTTDIYPISSLLRVERAAGICRSFRRPFRRPFRCSFLLKLFQVARDHRNCGHHLHVMQWNNHASSRNMQAAALALQHRLQEDEQTCAMKRKGCGARAGGVSWGGDRDAKRTWVSTLYILNLISDPSKRPQTHVTHMHEDPLRPVFFFFFPFFQYPHTA